MKPHLKLAHHYWETLITSDNLVIDATCGNGLDTLTLAKLSLGKGGSLYAIDIQSNALEATKNLLKENLAEDSFKSMKFVEGCHSVFPSEIQKLTVKLIVYNLGYLPKGDKSLTTRTETTIKSILNAKELICTQGAISIMCYPGHPEGEKEEKALLDLISTWNSHEWDCCYHQWINRPKSPSLLFLKKMKTP